MYALQNAPTSPHARHKLASSQILK